MILEYAAQFTLKDFLNFQNHNEDRNVKVLNSVCHKTNPKYVNVRRGLLGKREQWWGMKE